MDYLGDYSRSPAAVKRRGNDSQAGRFKRNVPVRAAEQQRSALHAELTQVTGRPQAVVMPLTVAALARHLQGMAENPRSGENGKVREAIHQ